jgi:hypothetical protein
MFKVLHLIENATGAATDVGAETIETARCRSVAFSTKLIPPDELPQTNAEMSAHATQLIARYPRDPRPRYLLAAELLDTNDLAGAEKQACAGLFRRSSLAPDIAGTGCRWPAYHIGNCA